MMSMGEMMVTSKMAITGDKKNSDYIKSMI
jgi:hypothetical protein